MNKNILWIGGGIIALILLLTRFKSTAMSTTNFNNILSPSEYNRINNKKVNENVLTVKNNNPGAIFHFSSNDWQGLVKSLAKEGKVAPFDTIANGVRAQLKTLISYQNKRGLKTTRDIITRYAPPVVTDPRNPHTNATENYIAFVAKGLGVDGNKVIDFTDRRLLAHFGWLQHIVEAGFSWVPFEVYLTQANKL